MTFNDCCREPELILEGMRAKRTSEPSFAPAQVTPASPVPGRVPRHTCLSYKGAVCYQTLTGGCL